MNNNRGRSLPLSYRVFSLVAILLIALMVAGTFFALANTSKKVKADNPSFTFTTTGDYGQTSNTTSVLQAIGSSGASFNMALGDLNYNYPSVTAQQWVTYAQQNLGNNSPPFEFVTGDHDYGKAPNYGKGDLSALETLLPWQNSLGTISGPAYGEEYSFDFPASNPLARFIMVSPGIFPTSTYNYSANQTDYNWVKNQVVAAKHNGEWVIVGMAEGCLLISSPSDKGVCPDSDLYQMLVNENVDLVIQAHLHYYAAGDQLALNSKCTSIPIDHTFNPNCVVDSSGNYTQGKGTVTVNDGTGGQNLISLNYTSDPNHNYFRTGAWDGSNVGKTYGYSQFTVSENQISMKFVPVVGGTFKDSFTISNGNPPPTPTPSPSPSATPSVTPSPSPSPSVTPSSTPGSTIAQDNFQRSNQTFWGTNSDGQTWGGDANTKKVFSIASDTGQVAGTSTNNYSAVLGPSATDAEVIFTGTFSSFTNGNNMGALLRWTDDNNWYKAYIDGKNLVLQKKVNGTLSKLTSVAFAATAGTSYSLAFSISGTTLSASVWPASGQQPSNWMVSTTDSSFSSGNCGVHVSLGSGVTADFTAFQAISQ